MPLKRLAIIFSPALIIAIVIFWFYSRPSDTIPDIPALGARTQAAKTILGKAGRIIVKNQPGALGIMADGSVARLVTSTRVVASATVSRGGSEAAASVFTAAEKEYLETQGKKDALAIGQKRLPAPAGHRMAYAIVDSAVTFDAAVGEPYSAVTATVTATVVGVAYPSDVAGTVVVEDVDLASGTVTFSIETEIESPPPAPSLEEVISSDEFAELSIAVCRNQSSGSLCRFIVAQTEFAGACSTFSAGAVLSCVPDKR